MEREIERERERERDDQHSKQYATILTHPANIILEVASLESNDVLMSTLFEKLNLTNNVLPHLGEEQEEEEHEEEEHEESTEEEGRDREL